MLTRIMRSSLFFVLALSACDEVSADEGERREPESNVDECVTPHNCDECVFYARCRLPSLPYGLFTLADKQAIINWHTPEPGVVAIIDVGNDVGHVAYVEAVDGDILTLAESNWIPDTCGTRSGTEAALGIIGYFKGM